MAIEDWYVDPSRSELKIKLRHMVVSEISGHVRRWSAELRIDPQRPDRSSVEAVLEAGSIDTGEGGRDERIRASEFLNVARYPKILFRSTSVTPTDSTRYRVVGELTIRDVSREVTLEVEDLGRKVSSACGATAAFEARASLNRQHFGLRWSQDLDTGGVVLGDKVEVQIAVQAVLSAVEGQAVSFPP